MTPERTSAAEAAISTHAPPGRTDSRGGPEGTQDLFGAILEKHQARTADAEGHKEKGPVSEDQVSGVGSRVSGNDADSDQPAAPEAPVAPDAAAIVAAAGAVALTVAPAVVAQPAPAGTAPVAPAEGGAAPALPLPAEVPAELPVQPEAGVPAAPAELPATPAAMELPAPAKPVEAPQPEPVAVEQPAQPKPQVQPDAQSSGQGQQQQPGQAPAQQIAPNGAAPAQQPAADATSTATQPPQPTGDKPAESVAQAPAQPTDPAGTQAPVVQPAQPSAPAASPVPATRYEPAAGMRLHQAVETVQAVVRMAQTNGVTRARVALHPEQLGSIEIHLTSTRDGIVAKVVADAAQAANVLRHAGEELRRSLESQGLNLVRFDVGTAGGQGERRSAFGHGEPGSGSNGRTPTDSMEETDVPADTTQEMTVQLPNGVLVDVLA